MTHVPMTCENFEAALADYLEHDVSDAVRLEIESHVDACPACGALLGDLERLRIDTRQLAPLVPSHDLWAGIESRLVTKVISIDSGKAIQDIPKRRTWFVPALAAAGLVVATATITHYVTRAQLAPAAAPAVAVVTPVPPAAQVPAARELAQAPAPPAPRAQVAAVRQPSQASVRFVRAEPAMYSAEPVIYNEITKLRAIVHERRHQLDPKTIAVLERSISVIDSAIQQSRAALVRDPASGFLASQLTRSLEVKVELLRTAASLPSRS